MQRLATITLFFLTLLHLHGQKNPAPTAEAAISNTHLIPGEQIHLFVRIRDGQPDYRPASPTIPNVAINFTQDITQLVNGRLSRVFQYRVTPANPGTYTIPSLTLASGGKQLKTPPITFHVHPHSSLTPIPIFPEKTGSPQALVGIFPAKTTLYPGEQCPLTLTLYTPRNLRLSGRDIPIPEKTNCLAWRFSNASDPSRVSINGTPYIATRYTTTFSGITPGTATFGPSSLRLIIRQRIIDPRIGPRITDTPAKLTLPAKNFTIIPFPTDAPSDFSGAVGNFQIAAHCSKLTLNAGESTGVTLQITGTGNLENLPPPTLTQQTPPLWKIIDTSKVTRNQERRYPSGTVTFRQLLRPLPRPQFPTPHSQFSIPPYSFTYFNPTDKQFHTLTTPPIPINVTPATADHESHITNQESTTVHPFIDNPTTHKSQTADRKSTYWHIAPAVLALLIIVPAILRKIATSRTRSPDARRRMAALQQLTETNPSDTRTFYRRAGRFIDQWLTLDEETSAILAERDAICFQPADAQLPALDPARSQQILSHLKHASKHLPIILLTLLLIPTTAPADDTRHSTPNTQHSNTQHSNAHSAWTAGHYQQAINLYHTQYPDPGTTPADILYNIGNCHHHLNRPGHAALAWRRALAANPTHPQARANLLLIQTKQNALVPPYPRWQLLIGTLHPHIYRTILHISLWTIAIAIIFLITRRRKTFTIFTLCLTLSFLAASIAALAALAGHYYPDDHTLAPLEQQAVVLSTTPLYPEPHRTTSHPKTNKKNPQLPASSLIKVKATRGPWTHITTSDGQEGWVESPHLEKIIPNHK